MTELTQNHIDRARAHAQSLGIQESGYTADAPTVSHAFWQGLSDASQGYANSILGLGGLNPRDLDAISEYTRDAIAAFIDETLPTEEATTTDDETPATFDSYHPALLPLFKRAADIATENGYCSVYDQLAAELGVPNREEIKRLTNATWVVKVPLTIMVDVEVAAGSEDEARQEASRVGMSNWDDISRRIVEVASDTSWGGNSLQGRLTGINEYTDGTHVRNSWDARETSPAPTL